MSFSPSHRSLRNAGHGFRAFLGALAVILFSTHLCRAAGSGVLDNGGFFSEQAKVDAAKVIAEAERTMHKDIAIRLTDGAYYAVPVLQHGEQLVCESGNDTQDVAQYVDLTWFGGRLFPEAIEAAHQCVIEFLENEVEARTFKLVDIHWIPAIPDIAHRGMVVRHKGRRFGRGCVDTWRRDAAAIRSELDRLLVRFEKTLRHQPLLFGAAPVYADFLLFGVLGNLTFNDWNRLTSEQRAIAEWRERLAAWRLPEKIA